MQVPVKQAYRYVKWFLIIAVVVVGVFMTCMAAATRFTGFITGHPYKFLAETLFFGVMGAVPIFLISKHRDALTISTILEFALLSVKFMVFWLLLELTGANAMFFNHNLT